MTALLRLLWRTQSFTLALDDSSTFSRHMCCTTVVHGVFTCISEPNSVARWEEEEERRAAGHRDFNPLRATRNPHIPAFGRIELGKA